MTRRPGLAQNLANRNTHYADPGHGRPGMPRRRAPKRADPCSGDSAEFHFGPTWTDSGGFGTFGRRLSVCGKPFPPPRRVPKAKAMPQWTRADGGSTARAHSMAARAIPPNPCSSASRRALTGARQSCNGRATPRRCAPRPRHGRPASPRRTWCSGPRLRRAGKIAVNGQLEAEQRPGVFAAGDCAMLTDPKTNIPLRPPAARRPSGRPWRIT